MQIGGTDLQMVLDFEQLNIGSNLKILAMRTG